MAELDANSLKIWRELDHHYDRLIEARLKFFAKDVDRVALIRFALKQGHMSTVMYIAPSLNEEERQQLFPEWLKSASCHHRHTLAARDLILSLPREWVLANIEVLVEPHLEGGTEDEYRAILGLYSQLGAKELADKLARRAVNHHDYEVRESGQDYLDAQ